MILNDKQQKEFETVVRPLMKFISNNTYPYVKVIVDYSKAEFFEGVISFVTEDYIKD